MLAIAPATALFPTNVLAANLTWDSSGTTPLAPVDGPGSWNATTAANWSNGATDVLWDNVSTAVFGGSSGSAGTVTIDDVSGTVTSAGVTFNKTGYTIAASGADTLTLSGTSPIITAGTGITATISAPIAGAFSSYTGGATITGLLLKGTGTINLSGVETYTGSTIIESNGVASTGATVNLTGGSLGTAASNIYVGLNPTASSTDASVLTMSGTSSLTAASLIVDFNFALGTISTTLGSTLNVNGTNTINTNNIIITAGRANGNTKGGLGTLKLGAGATLTLNDAANDGGAITLLDIANYSFESGGGTGTGTAGVVDFSAGTVTGNFTTINVATGKQGGSGTGAGVAVGTLSFANGTLNVGTMNIARSGRQGGNGTLTLASGSTGTINVTGGIILGANVGAVTATSLSTGIINVSGGTLNMSGSSITQAFGAVAGNSATINLNGGTLNMAGGAIGAAGNAVTLVATAGTLNGLASINGTDGVTMSGTGAQVLNLTGTNSYTGPTTVNGGTLVANGAASMGAGGALAVNGGTLDLAGFSQSVAGLSGTGGSAIITNNGVASPVTLTVTGNTGNYAGVIQNGASSVALSVSSTGTTKLTSATAQTYTGATNINAGGSLTIANINSTTTVTDNGTLVAAGTVGAIALDSAANLTPGPAVASGNTGILNAPSLSIGTGGASLNFLANSAVSFDQLLLTGTAILNGPLTVNATLTAAVTSGNYVLVNAPGGLTLNGNTVTHNVTVAGGGLTRLTGNITETATQIKLSVNGTPANLTWSGANDTTSWDIVNHTNWTSTAVSDPTRFYNLDNVLFNNATTNLTVNIAAPVQPSSVTFNNDASHNYTINSSSANGIGGAASVTLSGNGTVTLNTVNTYSGGTAVNAGTLVIGATGSIAGSTLAVASGATATVNAGGTVTTPTINVSGNLGVSGSVAGTTLTLSAPAVATVTSTGNISTPTVLINGGALTVQTSGTLASTSVTVANGASFTVQSGGLIPATPTLVDNGNVTFSSDQTIGALSGTDPTAKLFETGTLTTNGNGTFAGSIQDDGPGSLTVNAGTLILTGANTYSGATTLNTGATLQLDAGANTGSLNPATILNLTGTFINARTDSGSFANTLTGAGNFRQVGGGSLTLTPDNTAFSGAIQAYNGTIVQSGNTSLGSSPALVVGTPEPGGNASTTATGTIQLNAAVPATTVASISSTGGNLTASPAPSTINVPAGVTLTDSGTLTVGPNNNAVFSTLAITGGGALVANGTLTVSQNTSTGVLDLSGLNNVNISTATVNIANAASSGTLNLANTTVASVAPANTINVTTLNLGTIGTTIPVGTGTLNLGSGTNDITASAINLGTGRGYGTIQFTAGAPSSASVTINGSPTIVMCNNSNNGTPSGGISEMNLNGHNAEVTASSINMAINGGNLAGGASAAINFDTGNFTVGGTVTMASDTGGSSITGPTATITIGGATPNNTATGTFNAGNIVLGNFTNGNAFATASAIATATFTVNGGTANINGAITNNSTQGTTVSTLNLSGGTLNMNGNSIGGNGGVNSGNGAITVNLPSGSQAATLANLGGAGINGVGLTMGATGKLTLAGANAYTGGTSVNAGSLVVTGSITDTTGPVNVNGGSLGGNGSIASAVTVNSGGTLFVGTTNNTPGKTASTFTIGSASSLGGIAALDLTAANTSDKLILGDGTTSSVNFAGTLTVTKPNAFTLAAGQSYDLFDFGSATGTFSTLNLPSLGGGLGWSTTNLYTTGVISIISTGPAALTWNNSGTGGGDGITFDTAGQNNWNDGSAVAAKFTAGAAITFNDTNNGHFAVTLSGANSPSSTTVNATGNYVFSGAGSIAGSGNLTKSGTGNLTISNANSYSGGTSVSGGKLVVANTGALGTGGLAVHTGGTAQLQAGLATAVKLPSVTLDGTTGAWAGKVDITNNKLIIEDSATHATSLANAKNQAAFALANANAAGIFATGVTAGKQTIVLDNAVENQATFGTVSVGAGSILIMATFPGDANLDGKVTINDLNILAGHWQNVTSAWTFGDFNGSGKVEIGDLNILAGHWQNGAGAGDESFSEALASIPAFAGITTGAVPEPASLAVLGIGAAAMLVRRRKNA